MFSSRDRQRFLFIICGSPGTDSELITQAVFAEHPWRGWLSCVNPPRPVETLKGVFLWVTASLVIERKTKRQPEQRRRLLNTLGGLQFPKASPWLRVWSPVTQLTPSTSHQVWELRLVFVALRSRPQLQERWLLVTHTCPLSWRRALSRQEPTLEVTPQRLVRSQSVD